MSEEEQKPLSNDARAQSWGGATSKGMWVVNLGTVGWIVSARIVALKRQMEALLDPPPLG